MSHYRSAEARELQQERRTAEKIRHAERHAGRQNKYAAVRAFGTVTR